MFLPGDRFEYSNPGYEILGLIVERVSGMTFGAFLRLLSSVVSVTVVIALSAVMVVGGAATVSASAAEDSSSESKLPSAVDAKPH